MLRSDPRMICAAMTVNATFCGPGRKKDLPDNEGRSFKMQMVDEYRQDLSEKTEQAFFDVFFFLDLSDPVAAIGDRLAQLVGVERSFA